MMDNDEKIIKKYFSGYVDTVFNDCYCYLYRFGRSQREFYEKEGGYYGLQSFFGAGIKIAVDNCTAISFDMLCNRSDKEQFSIGIVYNGKQTENYMFDKGSTSAEFKFGGDDIELYFPYDAELGLKNIKIIGDPVEPKSRKILSFGDSITQGYMLTESAAAYPSELGRRFNADIYNFGIGGYFIRNGILNELDSLPKPWAVTFAYGTNDWHFEQDYKKDLPDIFKRLHDTYKDIPICVILPIARRSEKNEVTKEGTLEDVRRHIAAESEKYANFIIIKCGAKIDVENELYTDGIHPNNLGMRRLGRLIADEIETRLKEKNHV